jgi:hypothetical protein
VDRLGGGKPEALAVAALAALFLYVWLVIDPRLIFHGAGTISNFPVFKTGFGPLLDSICRPGGVVEYVTAFLAQLFIRSWAGAAVIVGLGWALLRVTDASVRLIRAPSLRFLRFAGPVALAITFARYRFEIQAYLAFVASAGLAVLVCRRSSRLNLLWLLGGSVAIYQIAGGAYVAYTAVCVLHEGFVCARWWRAAVLLLTLMLTPFAIGVLVFGYGPWEASTLLLPFSPGSLIHLIVPTSDEVPDGPAGLNAAVELLAAAGLYVVFLMSLLLNGFHRLLRSGPAGSARKAGERARPARRSVFRAVALAAAVAGLALVPDYRQRDAIESDYLAYHGRWSELVERAHGYSNGPLVLNSVNRALFHTGQLADRMFQFRQIGRDVLLLGRDPHVPFDEEAGLSAPRLWRRAQLHIDLGLLAVAKKELVALADFVGPRPLILRELALVTLAAGDTGAARILLGELSKSLFDSGWAAEKLALLDNDDRLAADPEIRRLRSGACSSDGTSSMLAVMDIYDMYLDDSEVLRRVLADYPANRMAFEYLAALRLLDRQPSGVAR